MSLRNIVLHQAGEWDAIFTVASESPAARLVRLGIGRAWILCYVPACLDTRRTPFAASEVIIACLPLSLDRVLQSHPSFGGLSTRAEPVSGSSYLQTHRPKTYFTRPFVSIEY